MDLISNILKILAIRLDSTVFHLFSGFLENAESYLLVFIFILIGQGWSIIYMDIEKKDDVGVPILIAFAIFGTLIQGMNVLADGQIDKYHSFYKGFGAVALSFRFIFLFYFIWGVLDAYKKKASIRNFLFQFGIIGCLFLID